MSGCGTKGTSSDVRSLVASEGKRTSREQPNSVTIDPKLKSSIPHRSAFRKKGPFRKRFPTLS
jgi:hypothetical protein